MKKFKILQLKSISTSYSFMPFHFALTHGFDLGDYKVVYEGVCDKYTGDTLDGLYETFNIRRPNDFKGHSLSVGDIVILDDKTWYCDSWDWKLIK